MDVQVERVAGIDISKRDAKVCVRVPSSRAGYYRKTVTTYGSMTGEIQRLGDDLVAAGVELVVMEATGTYWKPFFFGLADRLEVMLVNARAVKGIPGKKTDVNDAQWLAELAAHGLVSPCFVPDEPIRQLRDLTRTRKHLTQEKSREWSRLENNLEDAGIKIAAVVSTLTTKSARTILDALVAGERDPRVLAGLAHASMLPKSGQLIESLRGRFGDHHAFMVGMHLRRIDLIEADIAAIDDQVEKVVAPFRHLRDALTTIPGIKQNTASAIIAEIGTDMTRFPTQGHLASWAGVCPGQNESAGIVKSSHTRPGDAYLKAALGIAVLAIASSNSSLGIKYRRLRSRIGKRRAIVAIEHTLLNAIWRMLQTGEAWTERPPRTRTNKDQLDQAIRQIHRLGYDVELQPTAA